MLSYGVAELGWQYGGAGAKARLAEEGSPSERALLSEAATYKIIDRKKLDNKMEFGMQQLATRLLRPNEDEDDKSPNAKNKLGMILRKKVLFLQMCVHRKSGLRLAIFYLF